MLPCCKAAHLSHVSSPGQQFKVHIRAIPVHVKTYHEASMSSSKTSADECMRFITVQRLQALTHAYAQEIVWLQYMCQLRVLPGDLLRVEDGPSDTAS